MPKHELKRLKKKMNNIKPIPLKDIEESQQKIVSIICNLEEKGEIKIPRCDEGEVVV